MKKRTAERLNNLGRLRELHRNHPTNQPVVTIDELQFYHLRIGCEGRVYDYWPSTNKVWELNSHKPAVQMPVDDLWNLVTQGNADVTLSPGVPRFSPDWVH